MEKSESSAILKSQVNSEGAKNENSLKRWKFAVGISATVISCIASLAGIACVQLMDQIPPVERSTIYCGIGTKCTFATV